MEMRFQGFALKSTSVQLRPTSGFTQEIIREGRIFLGIIANAQAALAKEQFGALPRMRIGIQGITGVIECYLSRGKAIRIGRLGNTIAPATNGHHQIDFLVGFSQQENLHVISRIFGLKHQNCLRRVNTVLVNE